MSTESTAGEVVVGAVGITVLAILNSKLRTN